MGWLNSFSALQICLLGAAALLAGGAMWRGQLRSRRTTARDPIQEVQADLRAVGRTHLAEIERLRIQLHDDERRLLAELQTRSAVLDRLILEADREIARLQATLAEARRPWPQTLRMPDVVRGERADAA